MYVDELDFSPRDANDLTVRYFRVIEKPHASDDEAITIVAYQYEFAHCYRCNASSCEHTIPVHSFVKQ